MIEINSLISTFIGTTVGAIIAFLLQIIHEKKLEKIRELELIQDLQLQLLFHEGHIMDFYKKITEEEINPFHKLIINLEELQIDGKNVTFLLKADNKILSFINTLNESNKTLHLHFKERNEISEKHATIKLQMKEKKEQEHNLNKLAENSDSIFTALINESELYLKHSKETRKTLDKAARKLFPKPKWWQRPFSQKYAFIEYHESIERKELKDIS